MFERLRKWRKPCLEIELDEYPTKLKFKTEDEGDYYTLKPSMTSDIYNRFGSQLRIEIAKGEDLEESVKRIFKEFILPDYHKENENRDDRAWIYGTTLPKISTKRILDIGSGTGKFAKMAGANGKEVFCVDINEVLIKQARDETPYCVKASSERLPFKDSSFNDATQTAFFSIYLTNHRKTLSEMSRIGNEMIVTPNTSDLFYYYKHILEEMGYEIEDEGKQFRAKKK